MSTKKTSSTTSPDGVPSHDDHALAAAATISGGAAGAVVGAVAGPLGIVAGGAIGAAVGAISGAVFEREAHRRDEHDRELDAEIGVTDGSIGAPDSAKRPSLELIEEATRAKEEAEEAELARSRR